MTMHRALHAILSSTALLLASLTTSPARADPLCAMDLNGNGDAADPGETARCIATGSGNWQCPIERVACTSPHGGGAPSCPLGPAFRCEIPAAGGPPACARTACTEADASPIDEEPVTDDPGIPADGAVDADGNCTANIQIFSARTVQERREKNGEIAPRGETY